MRGHRRGLRHAAGLDRHRDGAVQVGDQVERHVLRRERQLGDRRARRAARPDVTRRRGGRADRRAGAAGAAARVVRTARSTRPTHQARSRRSRWWCSSSGSVPMPATRWITLPPRRSRSRSSPVTTRCRWARSPGSLGLRRRDDGRPPAAGGARGSWPTRCEEYTTFGRVRPDQKRAMVHALQSRGHTVAMTGDGVNDVLALKDADIGVAMGSGSSASRAVAQIVLLDNKFATLPLRRRRGPTRHRQHRTRLESVPHQDGVLGAARRAGRCRRVCRRRSSAPTRCCSRSSRSTSRSPRGSPSASRRSCCRWRPTGNARIPVSCDG